MANRKKRLATEAEKAKARRAGRQVPTYVDDDSSGGSSYTGSGATSSDCSSNSSSSSYGSDSGSCDSGSF